MSLWIGVLLVTVLFGWGAWQRRWIADDGLIVLRTVRNLLAGNGPVFNKGERIEANTSTAWSYLVTLGGWIGGPVRLEYVALTLALTLSIVGVALVMLGTGRLYAPSLQGRRAVLLPAGILVYIALPPARDFATSGLENGLVLAYLGLLWWMLVCWSQAPRRNPPAGPDPHDATSARFDATLAFVAGLSVLVRPELALLGVGALLMMFVAASGWRRRAVVFVAGGLLPVAYQIFRMGYYGLLTPGTAVAKDATGSKWQQGFVYLTNFNGPYLLWVPLILLVGLALLLLAVRGLLWGSGNSPGRYAPALRIREQPARNQGRLRRIVQSPNAIVVFMVVSGVVQAVYWIRQGGDFMHGRVLLTPIFCLVIPVAVIPIVLPQNARATRGPGILLAGATGVIWLAVIGWALWAANSPGLGADGTRVTASGIVDERKFYAQATGHAHPLTAADYLDYPRMRAVLVAINNTPDGALLLPSGNYDQWDVVPAVPPPVPEGGSEATGGSGSAAPSDYIPPHTVFFTNLGMLGMNVGLDVRVIDQIGLANPLAMHTSRIEDGRIGHDKNLFPDWAVAEGPFLKERPFIPPYLDPEWIAQAQVALTCPETDAMLNSVRGEMGPRRFLSNLLHAWQFTEYRIDRVPMYELYRCGLEPPAPKVAPYTGLPATGP
ncbi:hypothetical protein NM203_26825 [Mycolicibacterium sp. CAU 1645]|uniref:Terminal beta-(1->2)-arabinofuranosyltransferase C-terminal domain-containing protein n=1 Tax=Mycolicibacterium arenosum TaxID=2952157 RepID=A0ABT1M9J0_9MYCO|nr:hypothetical protein [Mycolicibacterium sp. CAU 1645]